MIAIQSECPWGSIQGRKEIADGVVEVTTASHGGIYVSPERMLEMPEPAYRFRGYGGLGWYEEDLDWAVVVLAFPQYFADERCHDAWQALHWDEGKYFDVMLEWTKTEEADAFMQKVIRHQASMEVQS